MIEYIPKKVTSLKSNGQRICNCNTSSVVPVNKGFQYCEFVTSSLRRNVSVMISQLPIAIKAQISANEEFAIP